jgi:hypothetical protein
MTATAEINRLIDAAAKESPDRERELCFISIENQLFLVWSKNHDALVAEDDPRVVADALSIRREAS